MIDWDGLPPEAVLFNPFRSDVRADPYPFYDRLRTEDPVHWTPFGFWILTRHADGAAVLRNRRFSMIDPRDRETVFGDLLGGDALEAVQRAMEKAMLFMNPPDHTRLRTLVSKAFTPRTVEAMRPRIQAIVDRLLDETGGRNELDVIGDLAYPLPVMVIAELMGVAAEDRGRFRQWSAELAPTIDPFVLPDAVERARRAMEEFADYFHVLIDERRRAPRDDLLSALVAAEEDGERLSEEELVVNSVLLLSAGHETTTNLIGNGLLALLRNPAERAKLAGDPTLVETAVEELLRYDSPVQVTGRKANEDVEIGGVTIRKGERALVVIGAANRDPARFEDPRRLDVERTDGDHLSFGGGIHYCLGASLARVEGQAAIATLLRRYPAIRLAEEPAWRETVTLRSLRALRVEI